jgi:hypothetical protein
MKTFKELYEACCSACEKREENMEESDSGLAAKADKSGVSIGTLRKVYKRGVAAWNSGHRPGTTPQQWGMARVNSYITKGKGTYHGADKDLREEELEEVAKDKESGLPKKYVSGLSPSTAKARAAHWEKMDKLSDKDPAAYEPAPGDATAKTKESKHTKKYREMFGEACWTGYKRVGMKKKGDKMVPNCVPEEVTLDEMSKLGDALAKIKHDFENPPADHKDAKPAPAKKPEPKKGAGMPYYPDSHGGRRYMGDSVEMDGETIAESNEENARAKVRETHSQILKKGYKYIGSEQRSVGKDDSLVTHNYLSKDGSHIHHMQYSPYTMTGKGGPHIFHKKTKFNAKLHDHLTEQCFNYFDEASPKAGKNVVPPHVGALATGGIVKEEGKDPLVSSWNKSLVKRIQGSKHPEHVKTNLLAKAKKSKSASDAELVHQELDNMHEESEGENKPLGKVMRAGDGKKKFKVYVKNAKGNTVKVGFGDPNMEIKRDDPERRKNFRARHNCDTATDRTTPRYWSCRQWRSSAKVEA